MKRSLEEYGDFIHDESFEDLIKRIAQNREDNRASQSINHTDTDTGTLQRKPEYFSIQLQKKAKEWDTFMSKNDNFKSQKKKKPTNIKSDNNPVQSSIAKWSRYINEIQYKSLSQNAFLKDENCSKERKHLLENLPKVDVKLSILEKQVELACKVKDQESKNVRSTFLQGILKKESDRKENKSQNEKNMYITSPETEFYLSFDHHDDSQNTIFGDADSIFN